MWAAIGAAQVLVMFLNGSLAYWFRARRCKREGKEAPRYLQYLFFPKGFPKLEEEAPRSTHVLVGIAAMLTAAFFVFCCVALAWDAEWSRMGHPLFAAILCLFLAGIGAAFLYLAWRLFTFRRLRSDAV